MASSDVTATEPHEAPTLAPRALGWKLIDIAMLAGVLVLALVVRVMNYDAAFSLDELWHLATTPGVGNRLGVFPYDVLLNGLPSQTSLENAAPVWWIWSGMDGVLHPPLFIILLRVWREIFGEGDFAAHFYSTFWSMISIGFLFAIARLALDRWAALLVCLGTSVSQVQMYYAQEVRAYQTIIALSTIILWLMTRIEIIGPTRRRAVALAAMTYPLLLTHYFTFGAVIAVGFYGMLRLRGHRVAFIATSVLAGLVYLISWVPFALEQIKYLSTGDSFLHVEHFSLTHEMLLATCAPWRTLVDKDYQSDLATLFAGLLFIVPWLLIRRHRPLLPWAMWLAAVVGAIIALDVVRSTAHLTFPRYFAAASPAVLLLAVGCVWTLDRRTGYLFGVALTVLIAVGGRADVRMALDSPHFATAGNYIRDRIAPGEAVLIYNGIAANKGDYLDQFSFTLSHERQFQHHPTVLMSKPLSDELLARLPARAWMAIGGLNMERKEAFEKFQILEERTFAGEGILLHLQLRGGPSPAGAAAATNPSTAPATSLPTTTTTGNP